MRFPSNSTTKPVRGQANVPTPNPAMFRSLVQAVANLLMVLCMALLTIPALAFLWLASIPFGYLKKQMPPGLTKAQVDTLRDHALRRTGEHYAGGL